VYQATHPVTDWGWGAVGLTIDTDSEALFVTYEESNTIQLLDATNFNDLGTTTAPNAGDLAGIVVDQDKGLVYTVDRTTDNLYVYIWDAVAKTLTLDDQVDLPNISSAHGIALDEVNDHLFVADRSSKTIRYFNTSDWTEAGNFDVSQFPSSIAVDVQNGLVYTGNAGGWGDGANLLSQYNMNTDTEATYVLPDAEDNVVGIAVDPVTGLVYVTTGGQYGGGSDRLFVCDSSLQELYSTDEHLGDPTGLCVPGKEISYNPLGLSKDDGLGEDECAGVGEQVTYDICFDNLANDFTADLVSLLDALPAEADFVSASDGGVYDAVEHSVSWDIGILEPGAEQQCVELVVEVTDAAEQGGTITNSVTISFVPAFPQTPEHASAAQAINPIQTTVNEITNICAEPAPQPIPCPDCPLNEQMGAYGWFCPAAATATMALMLIGIFVTTGRIRRQ
jgi:uncharacterized repeat protein (TIGR01451 family)